MLKTLLLKSRPSGGVLNRISWSGGGHDENRREAEARAWITCQRDRWTLNAPHLIGDGLVIEACPRT